MLLISQAWEPLGFALNDKKLRNWEGDVPFRVPRTWDQPPTSPTSGSTVSRSHLCPEYMKWFVNLAGLWERAKYALSVHLSSPGNTTLTAESGLAPCQPEPTDHLESWLQKFKA